MADQNPNSRLEAFCDGVFAIAMTLLVLDIKFPPSLEIHDTAALWLALRDLTPSLFTFILSFVIILITWANHHATLDLVRGSSASFIYANGFLLLTVVILPFPTAVLGEHLFTDHATPAVVLFNAVMAIQALAWVALCRAALTSRLVPDEDSITAMRTNMKMGVYALVAYTVFAVLAFWIPLAIAFLITCIWGFWLMHGIRTKTGQAGQAS